MTYCAYAVLKENTRESSFLQSLDRVISFRSRIVKVTASEILFFLTQLFCRGGPMNPLGEQQIVYVAYDSRKGLGKAGKMLYVNTQ